MADFTDKNIDWSRKSHFRPAQHLDQVQAYHPYTAEEERWMRSQFRRVDEAFKSVQTGEKLMQEFLACAAGITPLPAGHLAEVFRIFLERSRRMARIHPGVNVRKLFFLL
jgi:hypothetical protein